MTTAAATKKTMDELLADIPLPPMAQPASGRTWRLKAVDQREALSIMQKNDIEPILARLLAARGVKQQDVNAYINPSLRDALPDPYVLTDMERGASRIADAILTQTRVGVFGDYDVDGTTAAAILKKYFDAIDTPLEVYLPDRITEGYGPSLEAFLALKERGAEVIITVDCGAAAHEPAEGAAAEGLDIVVLDHHLMNGPPPKGAIATINPNRPDDISGLNNLSAAGVAFMAVVAINRRLRQAGYFDKQQEPELLSLLDLTALGLVCDVMEMTGLTRTLVAQGLKTLDKGGNPGLSALGARAGAKGRSSAYHLGFLLGPRINAAGRIGHAQLAFNLLTTTDTARAKQLAEQLHVMNAERQAIEADVQEAAIKTITVEQLDEDDIIVVAGEGWHPGVIGIVAGRIKEIYDRPSIVIGTGNGVGKGSGRSISGVDLGAAIGELKNQELLIAGGGHAMAAGLTVSVDNISALRSTLNERLSESIQIARQARTSDIDAIIAPQAVTKSFAEMVNQAGPFGPGNPEPLFALTDMQAKFIKTVGQNHLSVTLSNDAGASVRAIAFRAEGEPLGNILRSGERLHVAGKIRADDWRGGDAGQLQISDAALAT